MLEGVGAAAADMLRPPVVIRRPFPCLRRSRETPALAEIRGRMFDVDWKKIGKKEIMQYGLMYTLP